jgi:hypothetical protein
MWLNKENFHKSYSLARESLKSGKAKEVLKNFLVNEFSLQNSFQKEGRD